MRNCGTCNVDLGRKKKQFCSLPCYYIALSKRNEIHNSGGFKKGSESAKRMGAKMKKNCSFVTNPENIANNKGIKLNLSKEERKKRGERLNKNVNSKGLNIENGARCKFFEANGLRLQGRYELAYILNLIENNLPLPNKAKTIRTPYGFYTPDFQFSDRFIDVKSIYTIRTSNELGQMKKIKWVRKTIKPLVIVMISEKKVAEILSNYDLKDFSFSKESPRSVKIS